MALACLSLLSAPAAAQLDPAARGLAVQARNLALSSGRDPKMITANGDSRIDAIWIDGAHRIKNIRSPLVWASNLLDGRVIIGETFGKSGDRTDQILTRMPQMIATPAGIAVLQGCVNDISQNFPTAATSGATCAANMITASEMARLAGMKVILYLEIGAAGLNAAQVQQVNEANARFLDYQEGAPNVYLADARSAVLNPTASNTLLAWKAGFSGDGTHELGRGAFYDAQASIVPILQTIVPPRSVLVRNTVELPTNGRWQLLLNPLFSTATGGTLSGTATGTVPSGWTGFGSAGTTATFGTQADPDGLGNNATIACQWVNAGDSCRLFQTVGSVYWNAGETVQAIAKLRVTSASPCLSSARLELIINGTLAGVSTTVGSGDGYQASTAGSLGADQPYTATLVTRPTTAPAYSAKGYMAAYVYVEGSCAGTANVVVSQMAVKRRTSVAKALGFGS